MSSKARVIIALGVLVLIVAAVLGVEALRRRQSATQDLPPGSIPITRNGETVAAFTPADLEQVQQVSFVDAEEGKTQEGWLLRDVLRLTLEDMAWTPQTQVTVVSDSKSVQLTWAEIDDPANWVIFDLAGRGTLKLVSVLERLDTRDEWVQDVTSLVIE
ncbi:MAG: hypothetical protein JW892_01100 [Anaerolineae bacterium]|nr:hypothetical protein [Anaerolineae bacterium]